MNEPNPYETSADVDDGSDWRRTLGTTFGGVALALGVTLAFLVTLQTVGLCRYVATMDAPDGELRPIPLVGLGIVSFIGPLITLVPIGMLSWLAGRFRSSRGKSFAKYGTLCAALPIPIFLIGTFVFFWICRSRGL